MRLMLLIADVDAYTPWCLSQCSRLDSVAWDI